MADPAQNRRRGASSAGNVAEYLGHGLTWVGATLLFLLGGQQLDRWIGTEPLFTLLGALVGASAGFWSMYHHLVVAPRQKEERKGPGGSATPGEQPRE